VVSLLRNSHHAATLDIIVKKNFFLLDKLYTREIGLKTTVIEKSEPN